jgi:hypothetical protein
MVPGSVRRAPISTGNIPAVAASYAFMNSGDQGRPGNGKLL